MQTVKTRILALVLILLGIGLVYFNWHQLLKKGSYSMKMAAFGPLIGIGGVVPTILSVDGRKAQERKRESHGANCVCDWTSSRVSQLVLDGPGLFREIAESQ
jgi:hypothetical protein